MGTRKSKRQTKRKTSHERPPVDANEDLSVWSKAELIQELKGIDIEVPADLCKPIILNYSTVTFNPSKRRQS